MGGNSAAPLETFDAFAAALRQDLAPSGRLEGLLVERATLAAWRLNAAVQAESAALRKSSSRRAPRRTTDEARCRLDGEQRRLEETLGLLQELRDRRQPRWGRQPAPLASDSGVPRPDDEADDRTPMLSNESPILPKRPIEGTDDQAPESREPAIPWQDHLVFDPDVSETSPVVKGTWVTVGQVVSLIVDGWTWSDILRTHPELTEDDIRSCLAYTVEQDQGDLDY